MEINTVITYHCSHRQSSFFICTCQASKSCGGWQGQSRSKLRNMQIDKHKQIKRTSSSSWQHMHNCKYRKWQQKCFQRTPKSAEHGLDTLVAAVCDSRLWSEVSEVGSVYHLFIFVLWISDFCCSNLHMCTLQDRTDKMEFCQSFGWFLSILHNNHISIISPEISRGIAYSRPSIGMIMR